MLKKCIVCDKPFESNSTRYDNVTCSVACRSKLSRQRRKAFQERTARVTSPDYKNMMLWLQRHVPEAEHNLKKLEAIHGRDAFGFASKALQAFARHIAERQPKTT